MLTVHGSVTSHQLAYGGTAPEQVARQLEEVRNTATALRHRIVRDR